MLIMPYKAAQSSLLFDKFSEDPQLYNDRVATGKKECRGKAPKSVLILHAAESARRIRIA